MDNEAVSPTILNFSHADGQPHEKTEGFGEKTIGFTGGLCLIYNNITGPGMVALALIYGGAGWLPSTILMVLMAAASALACAFLIEAMSKLPGNSNFESRVEFMYLCMKTLPRHLTVLSMICFFFNLTASNVSCIIESAQTTDNTLLAIFNKTCALRILPFPPAFECVQQTAGASVTDSPFGDDMVISFGFLLVLVLCIPLGYWNIDDNIIVQIVATILLAGYCVIMWLAACFVEGIDSSRVPVTGGQFWQQIGPIVFNYAFVITIPSWVNEKRPDVNINKSIVVAMVCAVVTFVPIGWLTALAFYSSDNVDLLAKLSATSMWLPARIGAYLFPWAALVSGIPIFSIVIRYNLLEAKLCPRPMANFLAVISPWILGLLLSQGDLVNNVVQWGGLITTVPLNMMLPCYLYIVACNKYGVYHKTERIPGVAESLLDGDVLSNEPYYALPRSLRKHGITLAWAIIGISVVGNVLAIVFNILS